MVGTNRLKSAEQIAKSALSGVDAIKAKLDQLKRANQFVFTVADLASKLR